MADLFDIVVARKLSGGGGGGGSSDFSTAEVHLVYTGSGFAPNGAMPITLEEGYGGSPMAMGELIEIFDATYNAILYKGATIFDITSNGEYTISVSGNAELIPDSLTVYITGDCTITIS